MAEDTRRAGQIISKGPKKWLVRVYTGRNAAGSRQYISRTVHGGKKAADAKLSELLDKRNKGTLPIVRPKETVGEYLTAWLETTAAPSVRARTLHDYTATIDRYVRPHLAKARLSTLTPVEVRGMLATLTKQGLAPRTVRKAHEVLRNALEQAVADRLIVTNPARGRLVQKALPKMETKERQTVPVAKVKAFLDAAEDDRLAAYWALLLFGGLRPSEALALKWDDLQGDAITIRRVLVDKHGLPLHLAPPKSKKSARTVVLPRAAVESLARHRKRQLEEKLRAGPAWQDAGLIFPDEIGGFLKQDRTRHHFTKLLKAAGLPAMRIYDLRHSAATLLLEMGEDLKVVSERLGHSTIVLTGNTYAHVSRGMQERAAAKLDNLTG